MTLIFFFFSLFNSFVMRSLTPFFKPAVLIISGLIAIPTIIDWSDINIFYTSDGIADIFILLTAYLIPIAIISNWNNNNFILFYELILNLSIILLLNFICFDMTSFYIYFEASLIPLFLVILLFGANNKDKAADYILIYTLFSSLFMLIGISFYEIILDNTDYQSTSLLVLSVDLQCILYLAISIGIAVKTPLVPLHTWLPVVHSESPLAGSILLAGIILKLAIYAIIRMILPTLSDASILYTPMIYIICIISIIYTSLITLRQTDLKVIIAYSSISHMAICILGVYSNNYVGINGSLILSIAHGLVSPGLFIIVGGIIYDRYHNRLVQYYQGLITYMPILSIYLLVLSFCNTGTPLSLNFIGELASISGGISNSPILGSIATISVLLSASYQMKLTNRLTGGVKISNIKLTGDCTNRENIILIMLILPTIYFGVFTNKLVEMIWDINKLIYMIQI